MNPTNIHLCTSPLLFPLVDLISTIVLGLLESLLSGQTEQRFFKPTTILLLIYGEQGTPAIKVLLHNLDACYNSNNAKMSPTEQSVGFSYI